MHSMNCVNGVGSVLGTLTPCELYAVSGGGKIAYVSGGPNRVLFDSSNWTGVLFHMSGLIEAYVDGKCVAYTGPGPIE